ncbi:MAG: hypothetical protein ABGZ17_01305 [Planctomycetaceae bacterium]
MVWRARIEGKPASSPIYAAGKIDFLEEARGASLVIEAGPKFKQIARNTVSEKCKSSMGASQGNLFIRSERHLFCSGPRPATCCPDSHWKLFILHHGLLNRRTS